MAVHLAIELPGVPEAKGIQALDIDKGLTRAENLVKRLNQPEATVYRTNPHNGSYKKIIAQFENIHFDPEKAIKTKDHIVPVSEEKLAGKGKSRKRNKKSKGTAATASSTGPRTDFKVPLAAIAEKIEKDPAALRRKLRKSDIEKPGSGWGWDSWEDPAVKEILSWG